MIPRVLFLGGLWALPLVGQKPVINPGGVVNAASFASTTGPSHALVPGSIASIFGQNLAATTATASRSYPLPRTLGGTSVTVNGLTAPLFYVSPGQINFQVPFSTNPGPGGSYGQASVIVSTAGGVSAPVVADTYWSTPAIFTSDGSGCGQGAIVNVRPDGARSLNSPGNSASPGDYLEIYGTGFGETYSTPPDGMPAPADPLETPLYPANGFLGLTQGAGSIFNGGAPGLVGVDQMNIQVWSGAPQGCAVPLQLGGGNTSSRYGQLSQPVTVSIRSGGGQCVDPPRAYAGVLLLKKSVVLNDTTIPESDTLTAAFGSGPGYGSAYLYPAGPLLPQADNLIGSGAFYTVYQGPKCALPGYSTLKPGTVNVTGPGGNRVQVQPTLYTTNDLFRPIYRGALPAGFIQPGVFRVANVGGSGEDIGFDILAAVGSGIQLTSTFPKGPLSGPNPVKITWTGGQPGETVDLRVVWHSFPGDIFFDANAPATDGSLILPQAVLPSLGCLDVEIDVLVGALGPYPTYSLGPVNTEVRWLYEYRFPGITLPSSPGVPPCVPRAQTR
jgi:uncharacterized protein (TIGR03437 family)